MRGMIRALAVLICTGVIATPVSAQSSGLSQLFDRLGQTVERVMDDVGEAFEGDDHKVSWSQEADAFRWSGRMPAGGALEVKGINGTIEVERASGSEVVVTAQARGRRSDPQSVKVELVEHEGGLTFCAVYPTPDDARRENVCAPGSAGHMSVNRNDVEVTFHVQLPEGVSFVGRTVNGDIDAQDLDSDVDLETVNGDIEVSTAGFAQATTVNGSIDASLGSADSSDGLSFSTVNGSIDVDLPDNVDANLDAEWLNGGLESDLPIRLSGRMSRHSARGTLGDGGPDIKMSTVNGSIRIR